MIKRNLVLGFLLLSSVGALGQVVESATAGSAPLTVGGYFSFFDARYASNKVAGIGTYVDWSPLMTGNVGLEGEGRWLTFGGTHGFS